MSTYIVGFINEDGQAKAFRFAFSGNPDKQNVIDRVAKSCPDWCEFTETWANYNGASHVYDYFRHRINSGALKVLTKP